MIVIRKTLLCGTVVYMGTQAKRLERESYQHSPRQKKDSIRECGKERLGFPFETEPIDYMFIRVEEGEIIWKRYIQNYIYDISQE